MCIIYVGASKAGLDMLTKVMGLELGQYNVSTTIIDNTVEPLFWTPLGLLKLYD